MLHPIDPATATAETAQLFTTVKETLGVIPNMTKVMANSPALLNGYLQLSSALAKGSLPASLRERIALVVAEENGCAYCLSAHTYLASNVAKVDAAEIASARQAESADARIRAALRFASAVNTTRGGVGDDQLAAARAAGLSDGEIAEIIGHVAVNVLTNYFNKAARVEIDFPVVTPRPVAA